MHRLQTTHLQRNDKLQQTSGQKYTDQKQPLNLLKIQIYLCGFLDNISEKMKKDNYTLAVSKQAEAPNAYRCFLQLYRRANMLTSKCHYLIVVLQFWRHLKYKLLGFFTSNICLVRLLQERVILGAIFFFPSLQCQQSELPKTTTSFLAHSLAIKHASASHQTEVLICGLWDTM